MENNIEKCYNVVEVDSMKKVVILFTIMFLCFVNTVTASTGTVVCTGGDTSPLNVRDGIGGSYIGELSCNSTVEILDEEAGSTDSCSKWYQIKQGDLTGYSCGEYITVNRVIQNLKGKVSCVENDDPLSVRNGVNGTRVDYLSCDTEMDIIDSNIGSAGSCSNWYKIAYGDNKEGYVCGTYVITYVDVDYDNEDIKLYRDSLIASGFPESYVDYLVELHVLYPTWNFVPFNTYLDWNTVIDNEKPIITLKGGNDIIVLVNSKYNEPGYVALDNSDGDITENVVTRILQAATNQYLVEYRVGDSSENFTVKNRVINIVKGRICLTFDDGPSFDITPKVLDVLKENDIKATFFLLGYTKDKEDIVKRMYEEGHTIGLHGYSHAYSEIYTSIDVLMENFQKIEELVADTTNGYYSKIIRFPGGASNTVSKKYCKGIMSQAVIVAEEQGYIFYDWNVDSGDAGGAGTSDEIYENVISGIKPGRLNVVLMHDSSGREETLEALKRIIEYCKENCYSFEAITSETRPIIHHGVSN